MPTSLAITTDAGTVTEAVRPSLVRHHVAVPPGVTSRVRLTVLGVDGGGPGTSFSVATLQIPGIAPERPSTYPTSGTRR